MSNHPKLKAIFPIFFTEKNKRAAYIVTFTAFSLMFFFLIPLDLYLNNYNDFNINFLSVAFPLALTCLIVFVITIFLFPLIIKENVLEITAYIVCGLMLACYVQVLFLNHDMVSLTGDNIDYSSFDINRTINMILWLEILALPISFKWILKMRGVRAEPVLIGVSLVIIGMQLSGIVGVAPNYKSETVTGTGFFSYNKTFELSSDENICVFLLDRLDVKYMRAAIEKSPELLEQLDGFTFYENNISTDTNTFPAVTRMLTGVAYNRTDEWADYYEKAWSEYSFIDELRDNGYGSSLLLDKSCTFGLDSQINGRSDNMVKLNDSEVKINYSQIKKTTFNIAFGKLAPYYLKEKFLSQDDTGFNVSFYDLNTNIGDTLTPPSVSFETDMDFGNYLWGKGISLQNQQKMFTFTHLSGAHSGDSRIERILLNLQILNEYFNQMKELGIYDNATIIIIADHGRAPGEIENTDRVVLRSEITSALLIKPRNTRGKMITDSKSELSNENFGASILQIAGLPHQEHGLSYFDIIDGNLSPKRTIYVNGFTSFGKIMDQKGKYEITGDANNFDNWTHIPPESVQTEEINE
ncbi:MAG: hypothetical protein FWF94_04715 [Oscillospiraceae bacterium]|nr:hypothetical protein [Oscillospiraceae bacterium]